MGKRSPILGYNHNVRYRGLVFHVQTEDSGVLSPHLFTHLFHGGVIVSTRKLVYDAGSAEESIKSLMQAQHKAVMKDLRRGHFDDKIDAYLGGTPGLLPRGTEDGEGVERGKAAERAETVGRAETVEAAETLREAELAPSRPTLEDVAVGEPTVQVPTEVIEELSAPVLIFEKPQVPVRPPSRSITPPPIPRPAMERPAAALAAHAAPASIDTTLRTEAPVFEASDANDSAPEIEIQLEVDDVEAVAPPRRATRNTEADLSVSDLTRPTLDMSDHTRPTLGLDDHTRPTLGAVHEEARRASTISDGVPGAIRASSPVIPPPPAESRKLGDRPSTINAATLPPARPIARPPSRQALSSPQVVSRPLTSDDRARRESEAAEVCSAAPASAELPAADRAAQAASGGGGQYAQHKRISTRIPIDGLKNERSGGVAIPAGLSPPRRAATSPAPTKPAAPAAPVPPAGSAPTVIPREASTRTGGNTEPIAARATTSSPARIAPATPVTGRPGPSNGSGVVMTRPAVIVGAPAKTTATVPRIRKAREDEGRGFGQGLISEKSLDEVILAYLSEDADDK